MVGAPLFFPLDGQTKGGVVVGTIDYPMFLWKYQFPNNSSNNNPFFFG